MDRAHINYYITQLSNPRRDKYALMIEVLSRCSYPELQLFQKKTPRLFQGLFKIPYLKRKQYSDIFKRGRIIWNDAQDLFGAIAFIVINNSQDINRYVDLKQELDFVTATQQYNKAYELLRQIEEKVSVSITGKNYLLKLTRLDKGITASTQLHNQVCKENEHLSYITTMALKSASIDLPFEVEMEHYYKSMRADEEAKDFFTAFAFPYKPIKGRSWLRFLLYTSIIDLYEGFLLHISNMSPEELLCDRVKPIMMDLATCISDNRIKRLANIVAGSDVCNNNYVEEMSLIEDYYSGRYENVRDRGLLYLKSHPLDPAILDIYNRSCVKLDSIPEHGFSQDSLAARVHDISLFASANEEFSDMARTLLRNICIAWYTMPQLRQIYNQHTDINQERTGFVYKNYWRYSTVPEIRDASFFNTVESAKEYLLASGYELSSQQISILDGICPDVYNQTHRLLRGFSDSDISSFRKEVEDSDVAPIIKGSIISCIFNRLIAIGQFSEAISMYVKVRLENSYVKVNIDKKQIVAAMTDELDGRVSNQLELAVFYTLIEAEVYKRYLAYKRYLKQAGVHRASSLDISNNALLQYFVGKVCDRGVLTLHVREFETEDDVDAERIELCKKMVKNCNEKTYADEITSLIKEQEVKTLAQQVNDSKIHVDVESLVSSEMASEKLMYDTYNEVDDNLEVFEQKNIEGLLDYLKEQYEGKQIVVRYELPSVKYKRVLFTQLFLSVRDKFLFDPKYGLDKYLSARIRHGTLITQLRNQFLAHHLVTNKKDGGEYVKESVWTQRRDISLTDNSKEQINSRLLKFTEWLDDRLLNVKDERIQIITERNNTKEEGLFNYSEELMSPLIDSLGASGFESFDAFVHAAVTVLWEWTSKVLEEVRVFFLGYQNEVLDEMTNLQNDITSMLIGTPKLLNDFKDAITACRTDFQSDISVVSSWFKPEQSTVRFFTIRQAVETSLSVINKINQDALSFSEIIINETGTFKGEYFNAFHDIFHDMMNNILAYEKKRAKLKGKAKIRIGTENDILSIEVSNPIDLQDEERINGILLEQQNFPQLIAGGKTRKDINSGCVKIYSTVMYTLGVGNYYRNCLEGGCFISRIQINANKLRYHEDIIG